MAKHTDGDPDFEIYLEQIRRYPLLSPEEERALAREVQSSSWEAWDARDRMIRSNLRLVIAEAKRWQNRGLPLADLVEEGNVGLVHAVEKFDPEMNTRFSTYAMWWIKQAIRRAIQDRVKTVRIPGYMAAEVRRWRRHARAFEQEHGRAPTDEELVEAMQPAAGRKKFVLRLYKAMAAGNESVSLDVLFDSVQTLIDPRADRPDELEFLPMDAEKLREILGRIPEREAQILRMRYGFTELGQCMTLRQIAREVGISRERVRQLELQALARVRRMFEPGADAGRDGA